MPTLIALRPDEETLKKINILSKIYNTRTETIKRAIDMSYNGLIMQETINKLIPLLKNVFGENAKIKPSGFGRSSIFEEEEPFDFSYNEELCLFLYPFTS